MSSVANQPTALSRPCTAAGCQGTSTDPTHVVNLAPAGGLPVHAPLCALHRQQIDEGVEWFAEEKPGDPRTRGIEVVLGDELLKRRVAVAEEPGLTWRRGGFSPQLDPRRNFGVLGIEGRVYGSDERVHLDLVLTPDVLDQLRAVVRLYAEAGDPG
jgi:hypothetical protein